MRYMRQFLIIIAVTCIGEILRYCIPLPIPASIYGLVFMLVLLMTHKIRLEDVKETGEFLIEIMPLLFIPAGVGLMASWNQLKPILFPVCIITVVSTVLVMLATGKATDFFLERGGKGE